MSLEPNFKPVWWKPRSLQNIVSESNSYYYQRLILPTQVLAIDEALGGGLQSNCLFEIAGPSGSGKSQFCLTLLANLLLTYAEKEHNSCGICYIATEGTFPIRRLQEILRTRLADMEYDGVEDKITHLLSQVYIRVVSSPKELWVVLDKQIRQLLRNVQVRMIVLDSIAGLYRVMDDPLDEGKTLMDFAERAWKLYWIAAILSRIASEYNIWTVVTNQVSCRITSDQQSETRPALGLGWTQSLHSRLFLSFSEIGKEKSRNCRIIFSPFSEYIVNDTPFQIGTTGIEDNIVSK